MINEPRMARAIDHVVLPAESLEAARARYSTLGFTVAPDGLHPFGTENACIYLPDGTFLEPLAIAQREDCEASARKGNVFTARDQAWRFRNGENGFSALAMATGDARRDHKTFRKAGFSAGKKLAFSRKVVDAKGRQGKAAFLLAFAADLRSPDAFFFTCEKIRAPKIDRGMLQAHENGVTGILQVVMSEQNPTDFQYLLQEVVNNRNDEAHSFGLEIEASNGSIDVMTPEGIEVHFGVRRASADRGLRFEGLILSVRSVEALEAYLGRHGISYREMHGRIIVDAAPGQGLFLAFQGPV
ncbi:VOC family protein [Oricola thermophila]|uniref:VOC family protein n=1 Tax=Oricola thermophila TaxID=2742145 RepID=UPI003D16A8F0